MSALDDSRLSRKLNIGIGTILTVMGLIATLQAGYMHSIKGDMVKLSDRLDAHTAAEFHAGMPEEAKRAVREESIRLRQALTSSEENSKITEADLKELIKSVGRLEGMVESMRLEMQTLRREIRETR